MATTTADPHSSTLLVVGPGVLGSYAGVLWKELYPDSTVIGQTNSTANHDRLKQQGLIPRTKKQAEGQPQASFVLFAAPPSENYEEELKSAVAQWDGRGCFVFTSSAQVYTVDNREECREDSPTQAVGTNPRSDRILKAEAVVLGGGGNVLRLVGLYHTTRGAHSFFHRLQQVDRWGGYTVNLIHYEDAARMAIKVLQGAGMLEGSYYSGQVFLASDQHPITFDEMMASAKKCEMFPYPVTFTQK